MTKELAGGISMLAHFVYQQGATPAKVCQSTVSYPPVTMTVNSRAVEKGQIRSSLPPKRKPTRLKSHRISIAVWPHCSNFDWDRLFCHWFRQNDTYATCFLCNWSHKIPKLNSRLELVVLAKQRVEPLLHIWRTWCHFYFTRTVNSSYCGLYYRFR